MRINIQNVHTVAHFLPVLILEAARLRRELLDSEADGTEHNDTSDNDSDDDGELAGFLSRDIGAGTDGTRRQEGDARVVRRQRSDRLLARQLRARGRLAEADREVLPRRPVAQRRRRRRDERHLPRRHARLAGR